MPLPRLTVDAVLKMAHEQARRHQDQSLTEQTASPAMRQAIAQVWDLVRQRLGHSQEVQALDAMIAKLTDTAASTATASHAQNPQDH